MHVRTGPAGLLESVTDANGRFAIPRLVKPSNYEQFFLHLRVSKKGRATVQRTFSVKDTDEVMSGRITIKQPRECVVEGVLYLPGKTGPVPEGTRVVVIPPRSYHLEPRIEKTDKHGRFRAQALPPGRIAIVLAPPKFVVGKDGRRVGQPEPPFVLRTARVDVKPNQVAKLELVTERGAVVKGKVVKKSGEPVADVELTINDASSPNDAEGYGWRRAATNDEGEFTTRVVPGKVSIVVTNFPGNLYCPESGRSIDLSLADGEEKTDVVFTLTERAGPPVDYEKAREQISADFELAPGTYVLTWDPDTDCSAAACSY
ncbi:MAG: hypothetical protein ACPL7K_10090, partial [Armatimonadota bacterium]